MRSTVFTTASGNGRRNARSGAGSTGAVIWKSRLMPRKTRPNNSRYWSGKVTRESNALDLEPGVFTWTDPEKIARSLKRSAEMSTRRKSTPYGSAMSMLNFYINRAGKNLPYRKRRVLERAKTELRKLFRCERIGNHRGRQ